MAEDVLPQPVGELQGRPGAVRRAVSWIWALLPLLFALPAGPCFAWAAWRLHSRALAVEAAGYLAVSVLWVVLANQPGAASDAGAALAVAAMAVACVRALAIRRQVFFGRPAERAADPGAPAPPAVPRQWTPTFPAQAAPPPDPDNPATWAASVACNGHDRHSLSISMWHAAAVGLSGALLVALSVRFHVYGRGFGAGIGLLLMPVLAPLFARWVDGPVLYYRSWGVLHRLRLDTVTAVTTGRPALGSVSIQLTAPGLARPLRLSLRSRGYVMSRSARDHLRGWLSAPQVQWSPAAAALFDEHTDAATAPARRRHRVLAAFVGVVLPVGFAVTGAVLVWHQRAARSIAGAPGYQRYGGPHGKLLAVGRPWGRPCQPVRFTVEQHVPEWVYRQIAAVVAQARHDGIDVTLETRTFMWTPTSVYYPPGRTAATVPRVAIFWHTETPPTSAGRLERVNFGWDARVDPDGRHEDLTDVQADFFSQTLDGHPQAVRRSMRQLIAMTQGIVRTSRRDSGIARDTGIDRFSAADVAAMKLMSGCGDAALPVVAGGLPAGQPAG